MHSALEFLTQQLDLRTPRIARLMVLCFNRYVLGFLWYNPHVLDPDFAQIRARVLLTMANPPVGWLWTRHSAAAQQDWGQDEHATAFVLHVLDFLFDEGYLPREGDVDAAVRGIHRRLCIMQSLWLGNDVWVEDEQAQRQLRWALLRAMEDVQLAGRE